MLIPVFDNRIRQIPPEVRMNFQFILCGSIDIDLSNIASINLQAVFDFLKS